MLSDVDIITYPDDGHHKDTPSLATMIGNKPPTILDHKGHSYNVTYKPTMGDHYEVFISLLYLYDDLFTVSYNSIAAKGYMEYYNGQHDVVVAASIGGIRPYMSDIRTPGIRYIMGMLHDIAIDRDLLISPDVGHRLLSIRNTTLPMLPMYSGDVVTSMHSAILEHGNKTTIGDTYVDAMITHIYPFRISYLCLVNSRGTIIVDENTSTEDRNHILGTSMHSQFSIDHI